jgi:holo-[acyl-carrier protein] synthase
MIVGLGIDVCSIERMRRALERHGDRFFARICTEAERGDLTERDGATALAGRFAVKEAFAKALDGARGVGWHEVEVRRAPSGRPVLVLKGNAMAMAESFGADSWHVSITHDAGVAVAVVILESAAGSAAPGRAAKPEPRS